MKYLSSIPTGGPVWPRSLAVLGSTGSIGRQCLELIKAWPRYFQVKALAGGRNLKLLAEQANLFRPQILAIQDEDQGSLEQVRAWLDNGYKPEILCGQFGYTSIASAPHIDLLVSAQVGAAGLRGTLAAAFKGKTICLANKESLVLAGPLLRKVCAETGAVILPVDSEHYAIFQCLQGRDPATVRKLILTASGGPFLGLGPEALEQVTPEQAVSHPTWNMGRKISVDSATLMNKGLELIEACYLYGMSQDQVEVLIHPQSIVHSLVEFDDGSQLGQLAAPDMRLPLAACLAWPRMLDRATSQLPRLDLAQTGELRFAAPDTRAFPCLDLARRALDADQTIQLNAANEIAVQRFLDGEIRFTDIPRLIGHVLDLQPAPAKSRKGGAKKANLVSTLDDIEAIDRASRELAMAWETN